MDVIEFDTIWIMQRRLTDALIIMGLFSGGLFYLSIVEIFKRKYKAATRFLLAAALGIPALLLIVWLFPG